MALNTRALALAGVLAGTTIFASPAAAAPLPATGLGSSSQAFDASRFDPAADIADWRCRGYGCGYGRRGYRRNRIGAGDVLIGAAIIGGIAAIANSNNRRERDRDVVIIDRDVRVRDADRRYDDRRYDDRRYDDRRDDRRGDDRSGPRGSGASGLDSAVDQCLARIERDVRVDTVDNVERTGVGWVVSGALFNGTPFQCRIGNNGQIDGIDYSGGFSGAPSDIYTARAEGQWTDDRYAEARRTAGGSVQPQVAAAPSAERLPAYPGGPIPGEVIPETIDGDL